MSSSNASAAHEAGGGSAACCGGRRGGALFFYDRIESGVGDYFADCILRDLERLATFHGHHGLHFGFHRVLSERFPFGIYYREKNERIEVFAVLDLRMEPTWLREELRFRN